MKRFPDEEHVSTFTEVLLNQKRIIVCEHTVKVASHAVGQRVAHPPSSDGFPSYGQEVALALTCSS
jgi:hypothetical protein